MAKKRYVNEFIVDDSNTAELTKFQESYYQNSSILFYFSVRQIFEKNKKYIFTVLLIHGFHFCCGIG